LNHAVQTENIPRLPVRVRLLKVTRTLPKALSPGQVERLLSAADHRTKPIILTALHTGFRFQELISLNWSDVDFERRTISVTSKPEIGFAPKTHVERTNPMSQRLWSALKEHRSKLRHTRPQHPVFQMKAGIRWTPRLIRVIREVFETAGLYRKEDKSGLHQCRRTFATNLLDKGVSIETTRQLGGWASVVMVQTYATTADRAKREAVEQLPF
jgi:integrase